MTLEKYIQQAYVGRVLTGCEFGMNEPGCQSVTVPQRVTDAELGTTAGDNDPCIWLTLENRERAYFYMNEEIYFEVADTTLHVTTPYTVQQVINNLLQMIHELRNWDSSIINGPGWCKNRCESIVMRGIEGDANHPPKCCQQ